MHIQEIFFAKGNQIEFKTAALYKNINYIEDNDIVLTKDTDYTTTSSNIISFSKPLIEDDFVKIDYDSAKNTKSIISTVARRNVFDIVDKTTNSLKNNQVYTVKLKFNQNIDGALKEKDLNFNFTSAFNPMYSDIDDIRIDLCDYGKDLADKQIRRVLYDNSKGCAELIRQNYSALVNYINGIPQINFSMLNIYTTKSGTFLPNGAITPAVKDWVRYKTDLDLAYAIYLAITGAPGQLEKKIGPLEIMQRGKTIKIKDLLSKFQEHFDEADNELTNDKEFDSFVKAKNTAYPITANRNSF